MPSKLDSLAKQLTKWIEQEKQDRSFLYAPIEISPSKKAKKNKKEETSHSFPDQITTCEVLILSIDLDSKDQELLDKIGVAIDQRIAPCASLKIPKSCEATYLDQLKKKLHHCRHILISEPQLYQYPKLLAHYAQMPKRTLMDISLFLLADIKAYHKDMELKKSLWNTLLHHL